MAGSERPRLRRAQSASEATSSPHRVQFYEDDAFLVESVARYLGAGLGAGDAALVIATAPHREALAEALRRRGFDLKAARQEGRYVALDAAETLSRFMTDGAPDAERFAEVILAAMPRAAAGRRVSAFGEMVGVLAQEGKRDAAVRLEQLWNGLARRASFSLLCAYPMGAFAEQSHGETFGNVCAEHSRIVPAESFSRLGDTYERLREVARLQQKAKALEAEIARRREAEETLRQQNETFAALIQASPLPIVVMEADSTVRLWNGAAERLFGWSEDEVVGRPIPNVPPEKLAECATLRQAMARGERFQGVETSRRRRDGSAVDLVVSAAPLPDRDGVVQSMVLLFEDVTERKRAEADRQRALAEAEAGNRAKDEFLAMLGHELRNPLSAVRNAVVTAGLDPARRDRALDIARRGADQLGRLVDDLLDVARITQGRIVLRRQRVRMGSIVERALEAARPLIEERSHTVRLTSAASEVEVDGDTTRLEQVVTNLLANAAKYTDPGGRITVSLDREQHEVVLRVRDTGIGIAPPMLKRVFDLFAQAERGLDRAQGGLGIGLTVVKQLVELHGGRVQAHSDGVGTGAEFVVRLPVAASMREPVGALPPPDPIRRSCAHILLVEDNVDAAESLTMLLELLGHQARAVPDGATALEVAPVNPPDLMLIDIGLPGMDGYELARRIRMLPELGGVILVALTGYGGEEHRQRALAAGFDHHLVKPIDSDALEVLVGRLGRERLRRDETPTLQ